MNRSTEEEATRRSRCEIFMVDRMDHPPTRLRLRKIALWILIPVVVIGGLVLACVWYYIGTTNELKEELADFILAHPESTAAVVYTFDETGELVADDYSLFYNADKPLVLASTYKIVVLAAYADAVAKGELNPNKRVPIEQVEQFYLPSTDGGAHALGLKSVGLKAGDDGFARDPTATVTLDDVVRIMINYGGNAETDYLVTRLGPDRMASVARRAGLEAHSPIGLILGPILAAFNHEVPPFSASHLQSAIDQVSAGDTSHLDRLIELYLHDAEWRAAQIEFMKHLGEFGGDAQDAWAVQTMLGELMYKGTAREYAHMMAQVGSGTFLSPQVSEIMQQKLEDVPSDWPLRLLIYDRFGAKDGLAPGVLALASYGVPKSGVLRKQSRVVVVIANQLPLEDWGRQSQWDGHYHLPIDLARATGVFARFTLPSAPEATGTAGGRCYLLRQTSLRGQVLSKVK